MLSDLQFWWDLGGPPAVVAEPARQLQILIIAQPTNVPDWARERDRKRRQQVLADEERMLGGLL